MSIEDPFAGYTTGLDAPYSNALEVLPNDTVDLPILPRGVWCNVGGDIRMTLCNGETVTFSSRSEDPQGWPFRPVRIHATGTTATGIILVW